jgi:hypothetical protein
MLLMVSLVNPEDGISPGQACVSIAKTSLVIRFLVVVGLKNRRIISSYFFS